jgi:hypothetical protein
MRAWTDKAFASVGSGEPGARVLRICESNDEERAYHSGSGYSGWGGGVVYTTNQERIGSDLYALGWMNSWILQNWFEDRDAEVFWSVPTWIRTGLDGFVENGILQKGRFDFRPDPSEIVSIRKSVKEGTLLAPRDIMRADYEVFNKVEGSWTQCRAFVRYLLDGPGAQDKRLKGKIFEVLKTCGDIRREQEEASKNKAGDGADGSAYKEPETEEEEEAQAKKRSEEWKTREKEFLDEVAKRAFKDITDAEWSAIDRNWRAWAGQYQ